ncbi:helix-turn-helix domain-containing protein [Nocardia sp. CA-128927]|uniref:helix-turn-helix domain-containing protein n=1 Tax=Nocardia sp. CA-128927 TaxID=3239975 RepID=UPI003D99724D
MDRNWWAYVERIAPGRNLKEIAEVADLDPSQISRWKTGQSTPRAENVIRFARALGASPVEALVAAGYLETEEAASTVTVRTDVRDLSVEELVEGLSHRMDRIRRTNFDIAWVRDLGKLNIFKDAVTPGNLDENDHAIGGTHEGGYDETGLRRRMAEQIEASTYGDDVAVRYEESNRGK